MPGEEYPPRGARVRVRTQRLCGSAAFLNDLEGTVIDNHPIARGWILIWLDPNPRTSYAEWPIAAESVEVLGLPSNDQDS